VAELPLAPALGVDGRSAATFANAVAISRAKISGPYQANKDEIVMAARNWAFVPRSYKIAHAKRAVSVCQDSCHKRRHCKLRAGASFASACALPKKPGSKVFRAGEVAPILHDSAASALVSAPPGCNTWAVERRFVIVYTDDTFRAVRRRFSMRAQVLVEGGGIGGLTPGDASRKRD